MANKVDIWYVEYDVDYIPTNCDDYVVFKDKEAAEAFAKYKNLVGYVTRITKQTLDLTNSDDLEFYNGLPLEDE